MSQHTRSASQEESPAFIGRPVAGCAGYASNMKVNGEWITTMHRTEQEAVEFVHSFGLVADNE